MNDSNAIISNCGQYRYKLIRSWDSEKPKVMFIMLNPSTADADKDDPTIRRCINYAKTWGYGGIFVGNLYPLRATDPRALLNSENPIGIDNERHLSDMARESGIIICAWGNTKIVNQLRLKFPTYWPISTLVNMLFCLELTKDGKPKHPLYLSKQLLPIPYKDKVKSR